MNHYIQITMTCKITVAIVPIFPALAFPTFFTNKN